MNASLLINQQQVLMKGQDKTAKGITLKEYINTTNIRRMVVSRTKSKEKFKQRKSISTSRITHQRQERDGYLHLTRQQLTEEIKLKIAELIPSNSDLVPVLNMIDRLIELFTTQLSQQIKQNQITTSMLKDCSKLQMRAINLQQSQETKQNYGQNKVPHQNRNHIIQCVKQDRFDQSSLNIDDSRLRSESCSSIDIPSINLLLISKRQVSPHLQNQQQTKATFNQLNNDNVSFRSSVKNETSFFQKLGSDDKKKKCLIGSSVNEIYPQSAPVSCRNSQIKFSAISQIWNNITQTQNGLTKFQEYKMKSRR